MCENNKCDEELFAAWMHFAQWRERFLVGYVTVIAAISYVILNTSNAGYRTVLFWFSILFSIIYFMLEFRIRKTINSIQSYGKDISVFKSMNIIHINTKSCTSSFGFWVNILVSNVLGVSMAGFIRYSIFFWKQRKVEFSYVIIYIVTTILFVVFFWIIGKRQHNKHIKELNPDTSIPTIRYL